MRTQKRACELLSYDPANGEFRWKANRRPGHKAGDLAGSFDVYGYRRVKIDGLVYLCHRLAWLMTYGIWPAQQIDHINGIKDDNRLCNLRLATNAQNRQNLKRANRDSATGILGVGKAGNRFTAIIVHEGKGRWLGTFDRADQAQSAYLAAKVDLHPFQTLVPR